MAALLWVAVPAEAVHIDGVQSAALDQPRINVCLRRQPTGQPLEPAGAKDNKPKKDDPFAALLSSGPGYNIQAFLDTGSSGILLSPHTADALGVTREQADNKPVVFHDVGVGGGDQFNVSEPLYVAVAPYRGDSPSDPSQYTVQTGPVRTQVGPLGGGGLIQMLTGGLDIVGMPLLRGKIVILDPTPVDTFGDTMRARVYDPDHPGNDAPPPRVSRWVQLSFGDFKPFTQLAPSDARGPAMGANPFIGPAPVPPGNRDQTPAVSVTFGGHSATGSFLLDTGAAASMISTKLAAKLGVHYVADTQNSNQPKLAGIPANDQFTLSIGGIGGTHKAAGFYLDTLTLPVHQGDPIIYRRAPVLVSDITVKDRQTGRSITLDGVLGMNYFVASAAITGSSLLPDIDKLTQGPYRWIVIDLRAGRLGLELKK